MYSKVGPLLKQTNKKTNCETGSTQLTVLSEMEEQLLIKWKNFSVWLRIYCYINSRDGCELFENLQRW